MRAGDRHDASHARHGLGIRYCEVAPGDRLHVHVELPLVLAVSFEAVVCRLCDNVQRNDDGDAGTETLG